MNRLPLEKRTQILGLLVEGNSLRAISRLADVSINTVTKLLVDAGRACAEYQDKTLRNLTCKRIQCDEIWSFYYAKDKNLPADKKGGSVWTWVAIDADTKLVPCWRIGARDPWNGQTFMHDLKSRLANRVQLTTDGHKVYLLAVELAFGTEVDYAMLVKLYGNDPHGEDKQYSPAECIGCRAIAIEGNPKMRHISTSFAERQNLTMRMKMRRFTRLTNAFSKKFDNHLWSIALHYMYYNFCRIHQTLRVTPAMEAGIADHVWSIEEIVGLLGVTQREEVA
jgi:IS1 family transposase